MSKHHLNRLLALVLTLAMVLSVGFVLPVAADAPIELGYLHASEGTTQSGGGEITLYCDNAITENWQNMYAESADCVKLIKSGNDTVYNIGALTEYGTSDGILVSHSDTELVLRNSQWNLNCANQSSASPLAHGDTIIVGGNFTANGAVFHISTTYITKDADGYIHCSETFEAGELSSPTTVSDGITLNAEYKCYTETWAQFYADAASNVKLFRDGNEYNIGALTEYGTSDGILVSRNGNVLYLRNSQWNLNCTGISGLSPMTAGDVIYIGGTFTSSSGQTIHIPDTYISKDSEGTLTVTQESPIPSVIQAGAMIAGSNTTLNNGGFYFSMADNDIPYDTGWANEFYATSADCIKLIRGGGTEADAVSIAQTTAGRAPFIKYSESGYYFNGSDAWHLGDNGPLVNGDILIVEGEFTNGTTTFEVSKSVIVIGDDGSLTFTDTVPEPPIQAGVMELNANHASLNNGGFYFTMQDNDIPYTDNNWDNRFYATSTDCVKLVRGGGTEEDAVSIAQTTAGRAPFVKYNRNSYYFDGGNAWYIGDSAPLQNGDILIVDGEFTNGTTSFIVSKSVIVIGNDGALTFTDAVPAADNGLRINTASLTLYEDIAVNYAATVPEGMTDPYMVFTVGEQNYTVTSSREDSQGRLIFTFTNLTPDMMGDNISATLYATSDGDLVSYAKPTYSIKQYCTNVMAAYPDNAKLQTLLSDMLVYGAATQRFTGHNAGSLVTEGLDLNASEFSALTSTDRALTGTEDTNIRWTGAGLECGSRMNMYFTLSTTAGAATSVRLTINGRTKVYNYADMVTSDPNVCKVTFRGISASEYGDVVTAVLLNNGTQVGQTLTYSVNSYVYSMQNDETVANLSRLVQAIYNYGASAKNYIS
ncbi:MAG: hypothetical protein IJG45_03640 [Oscillospiraceae bacterium]|nr:hypothetical protein [Oscillospiraceae bacterium]